MRILLRRFSLLASFFLIIALALTGCQSGDSQEGGQESVRFALNLPLSGPIAAWSGQYPEGFRMGVNDACQEQDVNCDNFKISSQDNEGEPSQAVSVLQQQRLQEVNAYISGTSEMSNAIASQVGDLDAPHFIAAFICHERISEADADYASL